MAAASALRKRLKAWVTHFALVAVGSLGYLCLFFPFNLARIRGKKNIPRQGRNVLFVSNHLTMFDSVLVAVSAYFPAAFLHPSYPPYNFAAEENFFSRWYVRFLFRMLRTVPVKRGRKDVALILRYIKYLETNNILIFYQGGRSHDLDRIKSGAAFVISKARPTPVVIPVYHEGMDRIFTRGGPGSKGFLRWFPLSVLRRPTVSFGEAIDFSDLREIPDRKQRIAAINARIIERIKLLRDLAESEPVVSAAAS